MGKELVKNRISKYEEQQKQKLVQLGQSKKSYVNILAFLESEIAQSTKMSNFSYRLLCFRDDGIYQLNRAIEEIYGVSSGKADSNASGGEKMIETIDIFLNCSSLVPFARITVEIDWEKSNNVITLRTGLSSGVS